MLRKELATLGAAWMFLTRLPCPWAHRHPPNMGRSLRYFPLIGLGIGALAALAYRLAIWLHYPSTFATLVAFFTAVAITGAFHEDALADMCDGFGGTTPEKRLAIMRDSRLGTFGVLGLGLALAMKVSLLANMPPVSALWALLTAHGVSRWSSLVTLYRTPYAATSGSLAQLFAPPIPFLELAIGALWLFPLAAIYGPLNLGALLGCTGCISRLLAAYFARLLGGLSGDCLGAIISFTELICYAVLFFVPLR